jgi:aldose 1-epimerase
MPAAAARAGITRVPFGTGPAGEPLECITLRNRAGTEVRATTYGGVILSILTRDRHGALGDIALGFDTADAYFTAPGYFGALVGRFANRIAGAEFSLDGRRYHLAANNGANHLHGGRKGWSHAVWRAVTSHDARGIGVVLTHTSPDGDEGYPGTVSARVSYTLTADDDLVVEYEATTDQATVVNLTQHTYFNLSAGGSPDVRGHELQIHADRFTPTRADLIPTGDVAPVAGTALDFRSPTAIGARIDSGDVHVTLARGYDHNFVVNRDGGGLVPAARVVEPVSGRTLEVLTTQPGIQFYSANFLDGRLVGKGGAVYGPRAGLCLETQHFPDSPNQPDFPSTVLRPGQIYREKTVFKFGIIAAPCPEK